MSEMGDFWRQQKTNDQKLRSDRLKWNTEVVLWAEVEYGFKVVQNTPSHFSLWHPERGRLDYWPSTNKASWIHKKPLRHFTIPDIESYLMKHFKQ